MFAVPYTQIIKVNIQSLKSKKERGCQMKKPFMLLSACAMAFIATFTTGTGTVDASNPRYSFQTEDGKWDGEFSNESNGSGIEIELAKPLYSKTASGSSKLFNDYSKLWARLCNAKTKQCTTFHNLKSGKSTFTYMKAGKYYVDIKDDLPSASVSGKLYILLEGGC